ncbi:MAG: hypothetical protein NXI13_12715 [Proteobacteria bacterium]|nr:hypothetical protein [Pseudomonadota bacterium]
MKEFSADAAGFAALTLSELILQQCVIKGLFTRAEARELLETACQRHEENAEGADEKIALNTEAAFLLRSMGRGLKPLLADPEA